MKNRVPEFPNRRLITPEDGGTPYYAIIERADEPVEEGTPLNKLTLLTDTTEIEIWGSADNRTVDAALSFLSRSMQQIAMLTVSGTFNIADYGLTIGEKIDIYMVGAGSGGQNNYGSYSASGGYGGFCRLVKNFILTQTSYPYTIGKGGAGGKESTGSHGGNTTGFGYMAEGSLGCRPGGIIELNTSVSLNPSAICFDGSFGFGGLGYGTGAGTGTFPSLDFTPLNPYDGVYYGCGGGSASGRSNTASRGGGARGLGGGGHGTTSGTGGNGSFGGGGGGSMGTGSTDKGGNGGDGLIYIYAKR